MNKNKVRISYDDGAYWEITRTLSNSAGHTVPLAAGRVVFFGRLPSEPRRHRCEVVVSEEKDKGERPRMGEGRSVCRAAALRPPRAAGLLISSSCVALPKWAMVFGDGRSPPHVLPSLATKTKKNILYETCLAPLPPRSTPPPRPAAARRRTQSWSERCFSPLVDASPFSAEKSIQSSFF